MVEPFLSALANLVISNILVNRDRQFRLRERSDAKKSHRSSLFDEPTNTVSYLVSDPHTKKVAVVDPVLDYDHKSGEASTKSANVILEAAAMEVPSVATAVAGCVDAVAEGKTGLLVAPRSPEQLSVAISTYLDDPVLARRHGEQGRQRVLSLFRPEIVWDDLLKIYRMTADQAAAEKPD